MGGFLSDLFGAGEDLFYSTFDPKYGFLGRPVSGALRTGIDLARSLPSELEPVISPWTYQRYGPQIPEELDPEVTAWLDKVLGSGIESKMFHEPVQQRAEETLGIEYPREITAGELFRSAVVPELGKGDIPEELAVNVPFSEELITRETTPEDVEDIIETRHQLGGAVESAVNLAGILPLFAAAPHAVGPTFIPGMARTLGTELGEGEYGKAAVTGLALGGAGLGAAGRLGRGIFEEPVRESSMKAPERVVDPLEGWLRDAQEGYKLTDKQWEESQAGLARRELGRLREPPEGLMSPRDEVGKPPFFKFPEEVRITNMTKAFLERIKDEAAETLQNPGLKEAKLVEIRPFEQSWFDADTNTIYYSVTDIMERPDTIIHELAHSERLHQFGGLTREGRGFVPLAEGKVAEFDPSLTEHTYENLPKRAQFAADEHAWQTAQDALLNNPRIAENLAQFKENVERVRLEEKDTVLGEYDISLRERDPLERLLEDDYQDLADRPIVEPDYDIIEVPIKGLTEEQISKELSDLQKTGAYDLKRMNTEGEDVISGKVSKEPPKGARSPEETPPKEWRVTFNNGHTRFITAPDRGEAARIAKSEGMPEGADRIAGISERTPEMKEGVEREGILKRQVTWEVKLSDGSIRRRRGYSAESVGKSVQEALDEVGSDLKVEDVYQRAAIKREVSPEKRELAEEARTLAKSIKEGEEIKEPVPPSEPVVEPGEKPRLTKKEAESITKVLGMEEKKGEAPEVTAARKAVLEAITGEKPKPRAKEPPTERPPKEEGEGKRTAFKVTLSDGSEHIVRAKSREDARTQADYLLEEYRSTKTVDKVEEYITGLERAAKYEIEPEKLGKEEVGDTIREGKARKKEAEDLEKSLIRESQRLERAQVKEKLAKKSYVVTLSNHSKHPVRARSPERARQYVENRIRQTKSKLTVSKVEEKLTPLERTLREVPPDKTEALEKGLVDDATDIPKTFKFAFDISWPGRQGLFLLNRPEALRGMVKGSATATPFWGRRLHEEIKTELANRPNAELYERFGLNQYKYDPTEITQISQRMEEIPSERAAKLPGIRHSTRAFEDGANLTRANVFDMFDEKFRKQGKSPETNPDLWRGMSDYLNTLTMRKPLPQKLQRAAWILNKMMVSPMAVYSRLQMINPFWYKNLPPEMQRAALRDVGGTIGVSVALAGAAVFAAVQAGYDPEDVSMSLDPADTDFLRLKVGNTYYDYLTGLGTTIRTLYRIVGGRKKTRKGEYRVKGSLGLEPGLEELEEAPFGGTAWDEMMGFAEGKASPIVHAFKGITSGRGWYGEEYGFDDMMRDLFLPLSIEEPLEAYQRYDGVEAIKQTPGAFGVGVQLERPGEDEEKGYEIEYPF